MTARPTDTVCLPRRDSSVSALVVEAIAACVDADPTELGVTLYDTVDPDALDKLFHAKADGTPRTGGRVVFRIGECTVEVTEETVSATAEPVA